jgi:hypothetical protein
MSTQGLGAVGVYNAAMLAGVALSAPATGVLSARLDGRRLLQQTAIVEAFLRVATFLLLLQAAPTALVAAGVVLTNVMAWTGYAGMRAEVLAVDERAAAITRYTVCIAAVEAMGVATAALLPAGPTGAVGGPLLLAVVLLYAGSLVPTFLVARRARVKAAPRTRLGVFRSRPPIAALSAGFLVMALASGPTLLSVGLAATLHGRSWVAAAAVAFTVGSLAAPMLAGAFERLNLGPAVTWSLLGLGMVLGWVIAPWHPAGLLLAQCLAGLSMTAFEGTMDAKVASDDARRDVTTGLAWAAAARAIGGSAAVGVAPLLIARSSVSTVSGAAVFMLGTIAATACLLTSFRRKLPVPATGQTTAARLS